MKILGIDIGTTTISGVVYDTAGGIVTDSLTFKNNSALPPKAPGERMQDPLMIERTASELIDRMFDADIGAIGVTGQMHGILYTDRSGAPLSPLYTWQDGRAALPDQDGITPAAAFTALTGYPISSGYGLATHYCNLLETRVPAGAASLCTVYDWLAMRLCGLSSPVTHISSAASLGGFDLRRRCFDTDALRQVGTDISLLPEVKDDFTVIGYYREVPVVLPAGDNQASFRGAVGSNDDGALLVNIGTGAQVSRVTAECCSISGSIELRPYTGSRYLLVGSSLCGGRAYAILRQFFADVISYTDSDGCDIYDIMSRMALEPSAQPDPTVYTLFCGTRDDPDLRGSICGINDENFTPGSLVRGFLNGMADEMYSLAVSMPPATLKRLCVSGNAVRRNGYLRLALGERFGLVTALPPYDEEAACGAAMFAAGAVGES